MATSVADLSTNFFPSAENGFTTTTSGSVSSGAATVGLNSVAGYSNGEVAVFVIDPTDASKKQTFTGVIDTGGVQVTSVVWTAGTNQTHALGATVVDYETATHWSMVSKGILIAHEQTGIHKSGATYPSPVFSGSVTGTYTLAGTPTITSPTITGTVNGWVTGLTVPNTVTYNGNRSYDLVVNSTDLTGIMSSGMRLKLTRTVTAPTQCSDLESGSSQYFSKTSPNKLSFTDDYTVGAWVKLESYVAGGIIARRNIDTEGWSLGVSAIGQVVAGSYRIASNNSVTTSNVSIPLGKWTHVAASTDLSGTSVLIYINGVLVASTTVITGTITALVQGTTALVVGAEKSAGTNPFDGKIAQAFVATGVISAANIRTLVSQGLTAALITTFNIQSAYSLSNDITDLNTTTPNDLTAQGSALATNADSPFGLQADGTTAGTTDYAIITKTAFSTNTTLTVQVPEGNTIPTSGGVSAVSYSTQKAPYGFTTDFDRWSLVVLLKSQTAFTTTTTAAVFVNPGSGQITVPVGSWNLSYQGNISQENSSASIHAPVVALSTANNAVSDLELSAGYVIRSSSTSIGASPATLSKLVSVSSATPYYVIATIVAGAGTITVSTNGASLVDDLGDGVLKIVCAHL